MKLSNPVKNFLRFIGIKTAGFLFNVLLSTVKVRIENKESIEKLLVNNQNFVVAFWHGKMAVGWYIHRNMNCSALVSKSKDGDLLANILKRWNYKIVRGSSHIGGSEALEMLLELINQNYSLAITPDGPTGPANKMKAGAVISAKKSNVPLILAGISCNKKIVFQSWDKFELPLPFSKVTVKYSDAITIDKNLSYEETSGVITQCEILLNQLEKEAI
jgi:lysophospholipid acyltransferase (LPLAT)-like uncharacterized protein